MIHVFAQASNDIVEGYKVDSHLTDVLQVTITRLLYAPTLQHLMWWPAPASKDFM